MGQENPEFTAILAVLQKHQVEFIAIGGYAIQLSDINHLTTDLDLLADSTPQNMKKLANALEELGAKIRTRSGEEVELPFDPQLLATKKSWNLICPLGQFDVMTEIASTKKTYRDLVKNAIILWSGRIRVRAASFEDIFRSKLKANRKKDRDFFKKHGDEIVGP